MGKKGTWFAFWSSRRAHSSHTALSRSAAVWAGKLHAPRKVSRRSARLLNHSSGSNEVLATQCVQRKLACPVGGSPTGATVRSPVAWVASVTETKWMKPTDKAALGAVSESPGRNGNEPRVDWKIYPGLTSVAAAQSGEFVLRFSNLLCRMHFWRRTALEK